MSKCSRCEIMPESLPEKGTLYLSPPIASTKELIHSYLEKLGMEYKEIFPNIYEIRIHPGELKQLCSEYLCHVSPMEMKDTRCLLLAEKEDFSIPLLLKMQPLSELVARMRGEWLLDILKSGQIEIWFQPIVNTSEPSLIFAHECLARARDKNGKIILPGEMFSIARSADLMFHLDRICRTSAIRYAEQYKIESLVFINFNPSAIYSPEYCLKTTLQTARESGISPERIVFEVVESEDVKDKKHLSTIMNYYREHGFQVALDDLGAGYSSLNMLSILKPDFIKLDMELIRNVDTDTYKSVIVENFLRLARELGVKVIAEGVETLGEWQWLKEHKADFIQGFLFARPSLPPMKPKIPEI